MDRITAGSTCTSADKQKRTNASECSLELVTKANDLDFSTLGNDTTLDLRWNCEQKDRES